MNYLDIFVLLRKKLLINNKLILHMPKNSFITGLIIAAILPIVGYFFWQLLLETIANSSTGQGMGLTPTWRQRTVLLLAICTNLVPFQIFSKRREINSMRGISIPTILYVLMWVYHFKYILFG